MTVSLTHRAPHHVVAGDSIEFLVSVPSDYALWTGSARLTGPSAVMDATSVTTEGSDFHLFFAGVGGGVTTTAALATGQYMLAVWASDGMGRRATIGQFPLSIGPNLATGTPIQARAIRTLAAIEAAIDARISGNAIEEYSVDGTTTRKATLEELEKLRNKYAAEVARIQNPRNAIPSVKVAFTSSAHIPDLRQRLGLLP